MSMHSCIDQCYGDCMKPKLSPFQVRDNFLLSIDQILDVDAEIILESQVDSQSSSK